MTANVAEILSIEGLTAAYGEVQVLWGIEMRLHAGEIASLIGSNGVGKTTLMHTLAGLLPSNGGRYTIRGVSATGKPPVQILDAGIALVPEGRRLFSAMSVEENLFMGAYHRRLSRAQMRHSLERVYDIFPKLKLRRWQAAGTLSGGEQQMCAIGRGLMSAPNLLMIDELSLGLSPIAVEQLIDALKRLNAEGLNMLVVEQDVMTALNLSQRAFVMDRGRIVRCGLSTELLHDPAVRSAYLGVPTPD